jgi:hypothetical protein
MKPTFFLLALLTMALQAWRAEAQAGYVTSDFHQHTTYTDGSYSFGKMMEMNNRFGLDWWANSEHGGAFDRWGVVSGIDLGSEVTWEEAGLEETSMWRWKSIKDWSFKDVLLWRRVLTQKTIIQGLEMNVPGHEHASVAILGNQFRDTDPDAGAMAQFEYLFDANDNDQSEPFGWTKPALSGHEKAMEAMRWLVSNHPRDSWFIINHPERYAGSWSIDLLRRMNDVASEVFFGFTSIPGHQKYPIRGIYSAASAYNGHTTFGGTGEMAALVGGYWDALLSEGRKFWLFANSDCHNGEVYGTDFFPGEYQKNYTWVADKRDPQAIVDGLRKGNSYVVMGDLIDSLYFSIGNAMQGDSTMGTVFATVQDSATITIKVHDPMGKNNNVYSDYDSPALDHVDLIEGVVSGYRDTLDVEGYKVDKVNTTKVIARFSGRAELDSNSIVTRVWNDLGDGWKEMNYRVALNTGKKLYFRLRGTNHGVNEAGETDQMGNPLEDVEGENNAAVAFSDLWFYSNPVYVQSLQAVSMKSVSDKPWEALVDPTEKTLCIAFRKPYSGLLEAFDTAGKRVLTRALVNASNVKASLRNLPTGVYTVLIDGFSQKICN